MSSHKEIVALSPTARRNAWLAIAASFFGDFAFVLPIWLLYSLNHLHLSPTISVALFTGVFLVSALLEVPTGALADRMGRKRAFYIGKILFLIFPLGYVFEFSLSLFLVSALIAGFGSSLSSGALPPLVHAIYQAEGASKRDYTKFFTRSQAAMFLARVISGVGGAWLYVIHPVLPFVGWAFSTVCNIVIGFCVTDSHIADKTITYKAHIGSAIKQMMRSQVILLLLIMSVLIGLVTEAIWTGYQVFYTQDGQSPLVIGSLFSVIALFGAITVLLVRRTYARFSPFTILVFGSLLTLLTALLIYQPNGQLRLLAIVPMAVAAGFMFTTVQVAIQSIIPNKFHSTALAVGSLVAYGVYFVGSLWIGWVIDIYDVESARFAVFVSAIVSLLVVSAIGIVGARKYRFRIEDEENLIEPQR